MDVKEFTPKLRGTVRTPEEAVMEKGYLTEKMMYCSIKQVHFCTYGCGPQIGPLACRVFKGAEHVLLGSFINKGILLCFTNDVYLRVMHMYCIYVDIGEQ